MDCELHSIRHCPLHDVVIECLAEWCETCHSDGIIHVVLSPACVSSGYNYNMSANWDSEHKGNGDGGWRYSESELRSCAKVKVAVLGFPT